MSDTQGKLIIVNSITYAYRAKDLLYSKGYKAYIERIPAAKRETGCGYGVRVNGDGAEEIQLLSQGGIKVKDIIDL